MRIGTWQRGRCCDYSATSAPHQSVWPSVGIATPNRSTRLLKLGFVFLIDSDFPIRKIEIWNRTMITPKSKSILAIYGCMFLPFIHLRDDNARIVTKLMFC